MRCRAVQYGALWRGLGRYGEVRCGTCKEEPYIAVPV